MPANHIQLIAACLAMVLLVSAVGAAVLVLRVRGARQSSAQFRTPAESTAAAHRADGQAADNFRNLFEVPVLFFALAAIACRLGTMGLALLLVPVSGMLAFITARKILGR